jgi:hypothetical protein
VIPTARALISPQRQQGVSLALRAIFAQLHILRSHSYRALISRGGLAWDRNAEAHGHLAVFLLPIVGGVLAGRIE